MQDDAPYALKYEDARQRQRAMLSQPHVKPLFEYLNAVRTARGNGVFIPEFDPLDGGIHAKALFLFASPSAGPEESGFISRENPDPSALNVRALFENAGISRKDTMLWNVVPWAMDREVSKGDVADALPYHSPLLKRMDQLNLKVVVLLGLNAQKALPELKTLTKAEIKTTWMPSPRVFNTSPQKREEVQELFNEVARLLK
jgi:hypothetical protein